MNIESAYYLRITGIITGIKAIINGNQSFVPMSPGNRHYDEIMRLVDEGKLVIQEEEI